MGCALVAVRQRKNPKLRKTISGLATKSSVRKRDAQARKYYTQLLEQYPDSDLKAQAQFQSRRAVSRDNYLEAHFEYRKFLELYPLHPLASRAQFQLGMCSLQRVQTFDRAQVHTKEALAAFRLFRSKYPQDPLLAQAEEHIKNFCANASRNTNLRAAFLLQKGGVSCGDWAISQLDPGLS